MPGPNDTATMLARLEAIVAEQTKSISRLVSMFTQFQEHCDQRHSVLDSQVTRLREFDAFCKGKNELSSQTYIRLGLMVAIISALSTFGQYWVMRETAPISPPPPAVTRIYPAIPATPARTFRKGNEG